jgi:hypothetical protein
MHTKNAAVTSPRRSGGAIALTSACAPRNAIPWPTPPDTAAANSSTTECVGNASTRATRLNTTSPNPSD